jgi:hypothetical protein
MSIVLLLGSGPNVVTCRDWPRAPFDKIVAINNAWQVRPDWDHLVYPEDFPEDRRPTALTAGQSVVIAEDFVPAQNAYGGFVYGGGTMAYTAAYWALHALRPKVIACLGCDMVYPKTTQTHFYGKGTADPLREDITLRSLEAKSARILALAARQGCAMVNLSRDESRLAYPRSAPRDLPMVAYDRASNPAVDAALKAEAELGYMLPSGRYWEEADRFDADAIDRIDALWIATLPKRVR